MTNLLPNTLDFQGHPVRVIENAPQKARFVPVNDLADAVRRKRQGVTALIDRDPVLSEMKGVHVTSTPGGNQESYTLPYEGALLLLAKMNANRSATRTRLAEVQVEINALLTNAALPTQPVDP